MRRLIRDARPLPAPDICSATQVVLDSACAGTTSGWDFATGFVCPAVVQGADTSPIKAPPRSRPSYRRRPLPSAAHGGPRPRVPVWAGGCDGGRGFWIPACAGMTSGGISMLVSCAPPSCCDTRRKAPPRSLRRTGEGRYPVQCMAGPRPRGACLGGWCDGRRGFWIRPARQ